MANVCPTAFEYAPTATIVCLRRSGLQIIGQGEVIRRRWGRTLSRDAGTRFLAGTELYDLASPRFSQPVGIVPGGGQLFPSGTHLLRWCPNDRLAYISPKTGNRLIGLIRIEVASGDAEVWWKPDAPIPWLDAASLYLAQDGKTWVLQAGRRMQIGVERTLLPAYRDEEPLDRFTFDLPNARLIVSGSRSRTGLYPLPLVPDGTLLSEQWITGPEPLPVVSPLVRRGGEFLGVVRMAGEPGRRAAYEVWRFTEGLRPSGRFEGFPRRRSSEDEQALLPLEDGSVAWMIETDRTLIWPAPGVSRIETDAVRIIDPWLERHPPSDGALAGWLNGEPLDFETIGTLTPADREIMARHLLENLSDGIEDEEEVTLFEHLVQQDPAAIAPHAEAVVAWADKRLARLARASERAYWHVTRNGPPVAVDALVRRIQAKRPAEGGGDRPLSPELKRLLMLLTGVDTDYSLAHLGSLIAKDEGIRKFCRQVCLDVWDDGLAAVRRFTEEQLAVVLRPLEGDPPISPPSVLGFRRPTVAELDRPAFRPTDRLPHLSLLTVPVSMLPGKLHSRQPLHEFLYFGSQYYGDPTDTWDKFEALSHQRFEVKLQPVDAPVEEPFRLIGTLGGRPQWELDPAVPHCIQCGMTMFYVGAIRAAALLPELNEQTVYGFHCDYCGTMESVPQ